MNDGDPFILSVGRALPRHYASQEQITAMLREMWSRRHYNLDRLEDLQKAVKVQGRYLTLPVEAYREETTFAQRNAVWLETAIELGQAAVKDALERAQVPIEAVTHLLFTTITGVATPSVDARVMNRLPLRHDVKRTPLFGLGCAGGAAGIARATDYLRGDPDGVAVLLSVELCSLTLQRDDVSIPNIIATGLFGDAAAAVVLTRKSTFPTRARPRVMANRSVFYPDSESVMGWDVVDTGFKIILSAKVPEVVDQHVRKDVDAFLSSQGLDRSRIKHWIVHTGGPKVLEAFERTLELPPEALKGSWDSLSHEGNLSSASVLFVLANLFEKLDHAPPRPGELGVLAALGPGFCSELLLLQW